MRVRSWVVHRAHKLDVVSDLNQVKFMSLLEGESINEILMRNVRQNFDHM